MFDIVFWGHSHVDIDRFLPLMVSLDKKCIKTVLFYQNYDFRDGLSGVQQELIRRFSLNVMDYSDFMREDIALKINSIFVRIFKAWPKGRFLYNKSIGMRSKIVKRKMTEGMLRGVMSKLKPKINIFDTISLVKYTDYPYGSYYIKKISDGLGIKSLSIEHGGIVYVFDIKQNDFRDIDFDKIYVCCDFEKEWFRSKTVKENTPVVPIGDPRFDRGWRKMLQDIFVKDAEAFLKKQHVKAGTRILYIAPNLESYGAEKEKYRNLKDVIRMVKDIGNAALFIKPHPRYHDEDKIKKVAMRQGFKDYLILQNDFPLICYSGHVDFIISVSSSAVNDFLPEEIKKVVIYDSGNERPGIENIYTHGFNYFKDYSGLLNFFKKSINTTIAPSNDKWQGDFITGFCKKWISAGREMDSIVDGMAQDIYNELELINKTEKKI